MFYVVTLVTRASSFTVLQTHFTQTTSNYSKVHSPRNSKILIHSSCCSTSVVSINSFRSKKANKQDAQTICHRLARADRFGRYALATNKERRSHHLSFQCPLCLLLWGIWVSCQPTQSQATVSSSKQKEKEKLNKMGSCKSQSGQRLIETAHSHACSIRVIAYHAYLFYWALLCRFEKGTSYLASHYLYRR